MRVDRPARVGVGRAGFGEAPYQRAVADGGEEDAEQGQHVGAGHMPVGNAGDDAEGVEDGHRRDVGQADDDHLPEFQGLLELRAGGCGAVTVHARCAPESVRSGGGVKR
ncbi:hypothetical protein D3C77_535970 [compost metagenome]